MDSTEIASLAISWVDYWRAPEGSAERDSLFWINDREWDLVNDEPLFAWSLIREVLRLDSSGPIQEVLAAGPLEDLLAKHGALMIATIEAEAAANPAFAKLLGGVWQNSMSEEVWQRVQKAWDRRGWDGIPDA